MAEDAQYVTLGVAEERFAVPVERVQEILQVQRIARMPNAPPYFLGIIDVRGRSIPVVDLRLKLGLAAGQDTENTRIIVLRIDVEGRDVTIGLKTDRVFEVTLLDGDLEPPPEIGTLWRSDCIAGLGRRNGVFVTVLDLNRFFAAAETALVGAVAESRHCAA